MSESRRRIGRLLGLCALLTVLMVGAFLAAGWFLARPARQLVGQPPQDLEAEAVAIPVGDARVIQAWFARGRPGAGAVLLLHPVRGNRTTMLTRARFLHADGRAVLLVDMQAHGESQGARITFGARESADAHAAVAYLRSRQPNERIAAIGWSLGGAAALLGPPLAAALTIQLGLWTDVSARELRPVDAIRRLRAPVLIIAGELDPRTRLDESRRLFAAALEPKELWVVAGAGHDDFHDTHVVGYEAHVRAFLARYLGPGH